MIRIQLRSVLFIILFLSLAAAEGPYITRYYITALDFLAQRSVPVDRVRNIAHIVIGYDQSGRVIVRSEFDELGLEIEKSVFTYQRFDLEPQKKVVYRNQLLAKEIVFGGDSLSTVFLDYCWPGNTVIKWSDRRTECNFNLSGLCDTCRFYNGGDDQYGAVYYQYDSKNSLVSEEWYQEGRLIRKWLLVQDYNNNITRTIETDSLDRIVRDIRLRDDGWEQAVNWISPDDQAVINSSHVNFQLYTDLSDGAIDITWLGGKEDLIGTYSYRLYGVELRQGFLPVNLNLDEILSDSALYRISFSGTSVRSNPVIPVIIDSLLFDRTAPRLTLQVLPRGLRPLIAFSSSENLASGKLNYRLQCDTCQRTGSIVVPLTWEELNNKTDNLFIPVNQIELDSNYSYQVILQASDQAGNIGQSNVYTGFNFDNQPPRLEIFNPEPHSHIANTDLTLQSDEPVYRLFLEWKDLDTGVFRDTVIMTDIIDSMSTISNSGPDLTDGTYYVLTISAEDMLGNRSLSFTLDSLLADLTPPLITSIFPYDSAAIEETAVSYIFSEQLSRAEYLWQATDDTITYYIPLTGDELLPGKKIHLQLRNFPMVESLTNYTITLRGWDQAGNASNEVIISNVFYRGQGGR